MPALLLLLHRRRSRLNLFARADLVSITPAVLLQRTQLAGSPTHRCRDRLEACRQRLVRIDDWLRAQTLADQLAPAQLHRLLDRYAKQCCPVFDTFAPSYHWSFMQIEY